MKCFLCFEDFNSKGVKALLTHYSKDHYRLELEHNFITRSGKTWNDDKRCQECFINIQSREEYLQHIGVYHRMVDRELPAKYRLPPEALVEVSKSNFSLFVCVKQIEFCRKYQNLKHQVSNVQWKAVILRRKPRRLCWFTF